MSLKSLIHIHNRYNSAVADWETFTQNLKDYCEENKPIPNLFVNEDNKAVSIQFTDTKIVCNFEFENDHFYLVFKFVAKDEHGKDIFIVSTNVLVDARGETLSEEPGYMGFSLRDADDCWRIFFPPVLQAQKDAWMHAKANRYEGGE